MRTYNEGRFLTRFRELAAKEAIGNITPQEQAKLNKMSKLLDGGMSREEAVRAAEMDHLARLLRKHIGKQNRMIAKKQS